MPLTHYITHNPHTRVGVWHIAEDETYFIKKMPFTDIEQAEFDLKKGRNRVEWLATRYLLQVMTGWAGRIVKDEYGKPHWQDSPYHISISHSKDYSAAIVSTALVGIDIQYITPKIENVAWRVMNDDKLKILDTDNRVEHLNVYWGAKEALYKAYGVRDLDFKKNILLDPFQYPKNSQNTEGVFEGRVVKDGFRKAFKINYLKIKEYILVYAIEVIK